MPIAPEGATLWIVGKIIEFPAWAFKACSTRRPKQKRRAA